MGQIYIIGSKASSGEWAKSIGTLVSFPSVNVNDFVQIHDFVIRTFKDSNEDDKIIIDLDSTDPAVALTVAMCIRLSISDLKKSSLLPILLVSYLPILTFLSKGECSQIFMSQAGLAFCLPEDISANISILQPLTIDQYCPCFLDRIQINPDATVGTHSMANQWGADVLYRIISSDSLELTDEMLKEKKKLYYKYIFAKTENINNVVNANAETDCLINIKRLDTSNKNVLLIDDEASKGWELVLKKWLEGYANFDVCNYPINTYEKIEESIRHRIETDFYDLIFLDLRLQGSLEDDVYNPKDFSGMKILQKIKDLNPGNQVIMLTASNKAWNMKALQEEEADGFYFKESPESKFPKSFSQANFISLQDDVEKAFKCGYKRRIYRDIVSLQKSILSSGRIDGGLGNEIIKSITSALRQALKSKTKKDQAYAFLSLFQVFELICRDYITAWGKNKWIIDNSIPLHYYDTSGFRPIKQSVIVEEHPSIKRKLTAIYIEIGLNNNLRYLRDNVFISVDRRNAFVHNDIVKLKKNSISQIYEPNGFIHLLDTIKYYLQSLL